MDKKKSNLFYSMLVVLGCCLIVAAVAMVCKPAAVGLGGVIVTATGFAGIDNKEGKR